MHIMTDKIKGILAITTSALGFAAMAMLVRLSDDFGESISSFQKSFFRNIIAFAIAAFVFANSAYKKHQCSISDKPSRKIHLLLILRSLTGCVGIFANFYALSKIPIAEAMALNKTAPFFTVILSWVFLHEKAKPIQFVSLTTAFAGVLLIMKPGFDFHNPAALICALIGGLGAGIAYTCVRSLGLLNVNPAFIVLFFSAFSCLSSIPFAAVDFTPMTTTQIIILLGAGITGAIGQFGITLAYKYAPPKQIAVYDYSSILFTAILGFAFFNQVPDFFSAIGFALIVAAAFFANNFPACKAARR